MSRTRRTRCRTRFSARGKGSPVTESVWIEPYPDDLLEGGLDPEARYELRESVELAFVAALQHLPATQRAVVILRDVLAFSAAEVADLLETSVASVNSALQRARKSLDDRVGGPSQQAILRELGEDKQRELVDAFVTAWERADVPALLELLTEDARFTMPPLPAWFSGREAVGRFLRERVAETRWKLFPIHANGQLAFVAYQGEHGAEELGLGAVTVLTLSAGRILEISGFVDPAMYAAFGLAERISAR
ncbi:RNA polymerase subunit sigma-70 [Amycolatopsis orientalis]|uniref:RNA polymerase subunit sigma-70 n=1 Tax=Amycolatopsis orientalis TaxID=31958 RepID=UPI001EEE12F2|nr:RNA polymerase subunit sigma-70 [Amycolatopsis orientalis]